MRDQLSITILMAVFNGEAHLPEQLDSIAAQDYGAWRLIISDDGSTDASRTICAAFRDQLGDARVELIDGPGGGATQNFLHLVRYADAAETIAFADQDDVWLPNKLTRAVASLPQAEAAALYCSRTLICDAQLQGVEPSRHFRRLHGFRNALVQACTPGNTIVLNAAATQALRAASDVALRHPIEAHDWWAYLVVTGIGGEVIFDPEPSLLYRQHGANVMGRNDTAQGRLRRLGMLMQGDYGHWLTANAAALHEMRHQLTPENRLLLAGFRELLDMSGPLAAVQALRLGLYRQTRAEDLALWAAAALGRLRGRR